MKIGIITILKVKNFGAELQAYALQEKLNAMGHNAEVIDYLFYKHPDHVPTAMSRPLWDIGLLNRIKELIYPFYQGLYNGYGDGSKFIEFHLSYTNLSPSYSSMDQLYSANLDYDVFMVGSDQVWNPRTGTSLDPYFLTFAPSGSRTVSYASSFGVSEIPAAAVSYYADRLKRIDFLSVREAQGVDIVRRLTGRRAEHVLDPTLLLTREQWATVEELPDVPRPYVFLYDLFSSTYIANLAFHIAGLLGLDVVTLNKQPTDRRRSAVYVGDAGPSEFLGLLSGAAFVVTNSFHGTAFAVNFGKPFFSGVSRSKANSSRLYSLLSLTGLEQRIIVEQSPLPEASQLKVDFSSAQVKLAEARDRSVNFLTTSLSG